MNENLVAIHRKHLLPEFGQHGVYDPWWWPADPANEHSLWGLDPDHEREFQSLCSVPGRKTVNRYHGFGGSLSARTGCLFVVGERPSFNRSYASAVTFLHRLIPPERLNPQSIHFTDVVKFRGKRLKDGLTQKMMAVSTACLADELELLRPTGVIFTDMALDALKLLAQPWNLPAARLLPLVNKTSHRVVPHWKKRGAASAWTAVLGELMV